MASVSFYGSITPTLNVAHIVGTISSVGVYVFKADLGAMQSVDEVELRFNEKMTAGTVSAIYIGGPYANMQTTQIKVSPPVVVSSLAMVQIKQLAGTPRLFPFEVVSI